MHRHPIQFDAAFHVQLRFRDGAGGVTFEEQTAVTLSFSGEPAVVKAPALAGAHQLGFELVGCGEATSFAGAAVTIPQR